MSIRIPLPFSPDVNSGSIRVNGGFGNYHTGNIFYSVDFDVEVDARVLAQGNGTVVDIESSVPDSTDPIGSYRPVIREGNPSYGKIGMGNFVTVQYDEGFVATYQHLQKDSIAVGVDDRVIPHQLLGEVGVTGHIDGVHLHVTYGVQLYTPYTGDPNTTDDDEIAADGSQAANHNTAPVLFATPEDTPEDIDGWGILNPGTSYRGDNIENTVGGSGNDVLIGRANNSELRGGSGHDLLLAAAGNDTLFGEDGNDALSGGPGDNILNGGDGNDMLSGNPNANDVMTGGPGNDQFIPSTGCNTITDFNYAEDSLWLSLPEGVKASGIFNQWANATLLTYPNGTVALENVNLGPPIPGAPEDSAEPLNVAQNYSSWLDWSGTLLIA